MIKRIAIITTIGLLVCYCIGEMFIYEPMRSDSEKPRSNQVSHEANKELSYFNKIMTQGNSYSLIMALESEVPESSKALKFVALFREIQKVNSNLNQLINESRKLNELISVNLKNKEYVQTKH